MLNFRPKYPVCELFGIPIYVEISFLFLLLIFILNDGSLFYGILTALVLAASVVVHELAHSLTARAFGYRTRDITVSLLGGCASLIALPRKGWQEFLTALAGPVASFVLSGLAWLTLRTVPVHGEPAVVALVYFHYLNLMLGAFNLLPGFPMDGGRIFRSAMLAFLTREKATFVAMWVGRAFAVVLGFSGLHAMLTGGGWGFIRILIAWMIWKEGYREYLLARMDSGWREWSQGDFRARVSPPPWER